MTFVSTILIVCVSVLITPAHGMLAAEVDVSATGDLNSVNSMWSAARDRLRSRVAEGGAVELNTSPDIFLIPNFISSSEADALVRLSDMMLDFQDTAVPWCFKEYIIATRFANEFKEFTRVRDGHGVKPGDHCIRREDAQSIAHNLTFSTSAIVPVSI
jgi:hypothetical protein